MSGDKENTDLKNGEESTDAPETRASSAKDDGGSFSVDGDTVKSTDAPETSAKDALEEYIAQMSTEKQSYQKSADEVIDAPDIDSDPDFGKSGPVEMNFKNESSETTETPTGSASSAKETVPKGSTKMEKRKARVGASTSGNMSRLRIASYKAKFIDWLLPMFNSILNNDDDIKRFKAEPEDFEDIVEAIYDESAEREEELKEEWGLKYILATIYLPGTVSGLYYRGNNWYKNWKAKRKKPQKPQKPQPQARTAVSEPQSKPTATDRPKAPDATDTNVCKFPGCNVECSGAFCGTKHRKAYAYREKNHGWPDHNSFTCTEKLGYNPPQHFPETKK